MNREYFLFHQKKLTGFPSGGFYARNQYTRLIGRHSYPLYFIQHLMLSIRPTENSTKLKQNQP